MALEQWTSGGDYDRWMGRWSRLLAHEFLHWLNLPPGLRWIDVCCGSGILSEVIAEFNSPASVAGVDISREQIDFARRHRVRNNITFETADAMALHFAPASFDVAVCGLGLNYLPDPRKGLEQFTTIIKPGGTVAIYVWDYERGARFLREFWNAAVAVDPDATAFDQARRFPLCTPDGLRTLFAQTNLTDFAIDALNIVTGFSNFDDYWEPLLSGQGSAPNYLARCDSHTIGSIRERLSATLPVNASGTIELPARAWAVRARSTGI